MKHHHQKQFAEKFPLQQMLLNGHPYIPYIGFAKKTSLAHYEIACSRRSGQWREMKNGRKQRWKRVRGREQEGEKEVLSAALPDPSPFFLAHFCLRSSN